MGACRLANLRQEAALGTAAAAMSSWDKHIEANLRAPLVLAQQFAQQLPEGAEGAIVQAYHPPPDFDGKRPVVGAWMVGNEPAGIGVREDDSVVTKNLARFVPHVIEG